MFHRPRLWFAVHLCLFLGTVGACYLLYRSRNPDSKPAEAEPDYLLRSHLGLRSLRAPYRFPEGKDYLVVTIFEIENGGPARPNFTGWLSREDVRGPDIRLELIWGKVDGRMMVSENWTGFLGRSDDFWEHMDGFTVHGRDTKKPVWDGYEVVAFAESSRMIEPRRLIPNESDEIALAIGRRQFVALVAMKPCATKAEAVAEVERLNCYCP